MKSERINISCTCQGIIQLWQVHFVSQQNVGLFEKCPVLAWVGSVVAGPSACLLCVFLEYVVYP